MVIENVSFAELKCGNDIVFIPHIFKGDHDNGIIAKFIGTMYIGCPLFW